MAVRLSSPITLSRKSVRPGEPLVVSVKIENKGAESAVITPSVEGLVEGALTRPYEHPFPFAPATGTVGPRTREVLTFSWIATLPAGKSAHTFRGKLVLRHAESGKTVGELALDIYVG